MRLFVNEAYSLLDCEFPRSMETKLDSFQIPIMLTLNEDGSAMGFSEVTSRIVSQLHTVEILGHIT